MTRPIAAAAALFSIFRPYPRPKAFDYHHVDRPALCRPQWQPWCCTACCSHHLWYPGYPFRRSPLRVTEISKSLSLDERLRDCGSAGIPSSTPLALKSKANPIPGGNLNTVHSQRRWYALRQSVNSDSPLIITGVVAGGSGLSKNQLSAGELRIYWKVGAPY